ncbi:hypothetical protein [uncultured Campylobacter sp.]|nr:hypothetical protein [uncultured Campylobacter sp.]
MAKNEYLKDDEIDLLELVKILFLIKTSYFSNTFAILGRADELFER